MKIAPVSGAVFAQPRPALSFSQREGLGEGGRPGPPTFGSAIVVLLQSKNYAEL